MHRRTGRVPQLVRHRIFRAIVFSALAVITASFPSKVLADISIVGGTPERQARVAALLEQELEPNFSAATEVTVTIGIAALREECSIDSPRPIIATGLYQSHFAAATEVCRRPLVGIPADVPWVYQERLAKALFPGARLATLIADGDSEQLVSRPGVDEQLPVPGEGVAKSLGRLIREGQWDLFLLPIDHTVYGSADYRLALETLVRHRKPTVASVEPLLKGGAAAAAYFTPAQLDEALLASLTQFIETGELSSETPREVQVEVNRTVLRNIFGRTYTVDELREIKAEVNGV